MCLEKQPKFHKKFQVKLFNFFYLSVFAGKPCPENIMKLFGEFHSAHSEFSRLYRQFVTGLFNDQRPKPEIDIIESNLRFEIFDYCYFQI